MIIGIVIILGAVVGLICFETKGAGYGLLWDMILGISGYVIASFTMTAAYLLNNFGRLDVIGLNWYSMAIGTVGSLTMIYGVWLYHKANPINRMGFVIIKISDKIGSVSGKKLIN